ncbi:MAG: ABC transporter substrate-binding protein [Deltaproteobacteria bacterium]|jgi:polar amino acid transport system substrate-binding protein|nr:ABC transporter substrate-binding protein [Deltaproteobacteria bacterium]
MFKKIFFLSVMSIFLASSASGLLAQDEIVNGIDADFPPFAFIAENGEAQGFDVECVNWIAAKHGLKVSHKPYAWDSIIDLLQAKDIDMVASGLSVTAERAEQVAFTKPYWKIKQVLVVSKDSPLTLDDVLKTGKKIGAQSGTSDMAAMEAANGKDGTQYELVAYDTADLAAEDVANGRIDAAVMNDRRASEVIAHLQLQFLGYANIPDEDFAYAVNKENTGLLDTLNQGIDELMADPFWNELLKKYELEVKFE